MRAQGAILFAIALGFGCGGDPIVRLPSRTTPSGPGQAAYEGEVSIDGIAWADMNLDQRAKYMADVVMPSMRTLFVAHDPAAYQQGFGCATCHGHNATEVGFTMPNGLAPLDPDALPSPASGDTREAKWAAFMITQVTPQMAELLGEAPRDADGSGSFGCCRCHEAK